MLNTELVKAAISGEYEPIDPPSKAEQLESELLTPSPTFSSKWLDHFHPTRRLDPRLLSSKVGRAPIYDPRVRLQFERAGLEGRVQSMKLVSVPSEATTASSGMAMSRRMGSKKNNVRGKAGQMPFTPGGLEISESSAASDLHRDKHGLLDQAPGLSRPGRVNVSGKVDIDSLSLNDEKMYGVEEEKADGDLETASEISTIDSDLDTEQGSVSKEESNDEKLRNSKFNDIDELLPATSSFVRDVVQSSNLKQQAPQERNWAHMVDINKSFLNFNELVPNPARTWPFELDNFQKEAVYHLEQGDSVFIAAHTSAGKTVVAEYAMSMAAQHMTKCIYTSPIKALSNQKYRDFKREYDDVGILTGDVQLNPDASTLIMTTEILRSMLYRGADIIRDVEFIIFDEVHYVNDSERGVVWEEVIIMLPDHVKLVLLSATVPNTFEFANWVGRTKEKDVYVISTPKRPVPLQHYLWIKNQMVELVGADRKFNSVNYKKAEDLLNPPKPAAKTERGGGSSGGRGGSAASGRGGKDQRGGRKPQKSRVEAQVGPQKGRFNSGVASKTELLNLVDHLRTQKLLPAVMFVFSRKQCEQMAQNLQSVALNTANERSQVYMFMDKAVARLKKEDRELPQIQTLRSLLQQGIGVHHSGLLPIMKEVVEILFAKGLVKLLFATETFAMGLNLPTRTVVFTSVKKFDSTVMRFLSPGEYTQMAGRAGRRGLDSVGTVIIMNSNKDQVIPSASLNLMMLGTPQKLSSQFRLTYNMILSLLRIEALRVEDVIQQSFSENNAHVLRPEREKRLIAAEKAAQDARKELVAQQRKLWLDDSITNALTVYHKAASRYQELTVEAYKYASTIRSDGPDRVRFCFYRSDFSGSLMVGAAYRWFDGRKDEPVSVGIVSLGTVKGPWTFLPYANKLNASGETPYAKMDTFSEIRSKVIPLKALEFMSDCTVRVTEDPKKPSQSMKTLLLNTYRSKLDLIHTEANMDKKNKIELRLALRDRADTEEEMRVAGNELMTLLATHTESLKSAPSPNKQLSGYETLYTNIKKQAIAEREAIEIRASATVSNTALLPDYEQRMNVLRAAHYVDEDFNVALKGRVACEISTGYELYVTELIMDNFLGSYEPEEIVALLSAFVFEGARGADDPPTVTPRLDEGRARLLELVEYVQGLATEHQVPLTQDEANFTENNRFALMQVVYEWARGMSFSEITTLTSIQEGLIVRVINRLDEVCRSVMSAARLIGAADLYDKLAIAQERIKRDIVFCSSLYL